MLDPAHGRWRRLGAVVVSAALAIGLGSTLLAQSPPARTSTLFQPAPTATPVASAAPVASPSSQGMVAVVIPSDGLNLREAPDRMSASLAVLPVGTQVPVVGGIVNGAWVPVVYEGKNGFVSAEFVEIRPAGASASSPSARPVATPPAPTPAPTPPPRPALSPSSALFDNGVLLQGVYAFDIDDAITIADEFKIIAVVRPPEG